MSSRVIINIFSLKGNEFIFKYLRLILHVDCKKWSFQKEKIDFDSLNCWILYKQRANSLLK